MKDLALGTDKSSAMLSSRRCFSGSRAFLLVLSLLLIAQGCTSVAKRHPLPEDKSAESRVLGRSDLRFWGDDPLPAGQDLIEPTLEELKTLFPAFVGRELNFLAISGGGPNGAFAAGLLNGWSASGTRPEFTVVTGVSTGALVAPFAYLGPDYDHLLEQIYTEYSTEDLVRKRSLLQVLSGDSGLDTEPLSARIAKYVDEAVMNAIAAEHRRGRLLLIGTTNLDAARPVTWDIGAIASSGHPDALDLIRDVMLASASIPVAFPPVMIDVEVDDQRFDEMHVDGGATRQSFLFHLASDEDVFQTLNIVGRGRAFFVHNAQLDPGWKAVDRKILSIAVRSASSMILSNGSGDLYREYLGAQKFDFDFNLAYIPADFEADKDELFDRNYMRDLYDFAYESAVNGYPWKKKPPALETM